jgi:hypothetical protein
VTLCARLRRSVVPAVLPVALLVPAAPAAADAGQTPVVAPAPVAVEGADSPTAAALLPESLQPEEPGTFDVVGHNPLYGRGMNAALAVHRGHVYIGNRTDATPGHAHPGILVVDATDPSKPKVVNEVLGEQAQVGVTSRELRVWPQQELLLVMNFECSALIHRCTSTGAFGSQRNAIRFYDISDPANPTLVSTYTTPRSPHEMHLWLDPERPGRALLYYSTPTSRLDRPNMIVTDISGARDGKFVEVGRFNANDAFSPEDRREFDVRLHSMATTADGRRTHLAYLGGGYLLLDTSDFAEDLPDPQFRLLTEVEDRVSWGNPGAHSAVEIPQRPDLALATDEVYGKFGGVLADHGCPWGWVRILDIENLDAPSVLSEYKLPENEESFCETERAKDPRTENFTSFSAHNPTVVSKDLALVTWHGKGLQAIDLRNPAKPVSAGEFLPADPLATVTTEDPALGGGNIDNVAGGTRDKVIMWSFPIVVDGLIYVVDLRNGLYILSYDGALDDAVDGTAFAEGNSNVGHVLELEANAAEAGLAKAETHSSGD